MTQSKKIDFLDALEEGSEITASVSGWLLLKVAELTILNTQDPGEKRRRGLQFLKLQDELSMPWFSETSFPISGVAENYWAEERNWLSCHKDTFGEQQLLYGLTYRFLRVFACNHFSSPFFTNEGGKRIPDTEDFTYRNQHLFNKFLVHSSEYLDANSLGGINFSGMLKSTEYELHERDWKTIKSAAFLGMVGTASAAGGWIAGPAIGGAIGTAMGLSGAAATSSGLALLGLGALAKGGFGMAGGQTVVALASFLSGSFAAAKATSNELKQHRDRSILILPVVLTLGRILNEMGEERLISQLIHKRIKTRLKEFQTRRNKLDPSTKETKKYLDSMIDIYDQASEMSESYDWFSFGHDLFNDPWEEAAA